MSLNLFPKSKEWALHRGFRQQAWLDLPKSMEPELDWWQDEQAASIGYTRRYH